MKPSEIMLNLLTEVRNDIKEIRTKDIPKLQVSHAELNQRVQDEAKFHSRAYARVYGAITIVISLAAVAVAMFKH